MLLNLYSWRVLGNDDRNISRTSSFLPFYRIYCIPVQSALLLFAWVLIGCSSLVFQNSYFFINSFSLSSHITLYTKSSSMLWIIFHRLVARCQNNSSVIFFLSKNLHRTYPNNSVAHAIIYILPVVWEVKKKYNLTFNLSQLYRISRKD